MRELGESSTRRDFFEWLASWVAVVTAFPTLDIPWSTRMRAGILAAPADAHDESSNPIRLLTRICADSTGYRRIGRAYLERFPAEAEIGRLRRRLGLNKIADANHLERHLRARSRDDLEHHRTLFMNGWLLTRTEARYCGLVTLALGDRP